VTAEQARAVIDAARTTRDRLLLETLWQTGGRVSEVLALRRRDVDATEGALELANKKQRRADRGRKLVYVASGLVAARLAYCREHGVPAGGYVFASAQAPGAPISRVQLWRLVTGCARRAGVGVDLADGTRRPVSGLDFRHGAAVHQLRAGVPLSEVSQQLGHARLDTTLIYTRLTNADRRAYADRVRW
jgi:integrase/recombinase XerD